MATKKIKQTTFNRRAYDSIQLEDVMDALEKAIPDEATRRAFRGLGLLIGKVVSDVSEIAATVRGQNGHDGLIARVLAIETKLSSIESFQQKILDAVLDERKVVKPTEEKEEDEKEGITFQWLVEKVFLPIIIPVTVTIVTISLALSGYIKLGGG